MGCDTTRPMFIAPSRQRLRGSVRDQPQRQSLVTADDVVERPYRLAREFDSADLLHQRTEDRLHLDAGQSLPGTGMRAVPETELTVGVAADVKGVSIGPLPFVAVSGCVKHQHPRSGGEVNTGDRAVLHRLSRE